jgi:hypothetical protein
MMLKLELLPAKCGDCLWLEYGVPPATHVVIIDGGLRETATVLRKRLDRARRERGVATLDVELVVVTHIDNDHILGVIELLGSARPPLDAKDLWFNGKPQLMQLPKPTTVVAGRRTGPPDLMGGDMDEAAPAGPLESPADLLGPQQGDQLSELLARPGQKWNEHWNRAAIVVPETGKLPTATLDGGLTLTILGPTYGNLYTLCRAWPSVLNGIDEPAVTAAPGDLLGRGDTWPPTWKASEKKDPSAANGSSIMLLAEYGAHALLLAGDGHAPDLAAALERLRAERNLGTEPLPIEAFKLPHHGSDKNLTKAVLDQLDCTRYLISTDGTNHGHPDHQALLRILRYSKSAPQLGFNYRSDTTRPWGERKSDIVSAGFRDYTFEYAPDTTDGLVVEFR